MRQIPSVLSDLIPHRQYTGGEDARTPGVHVSDVVKSLCAALDPKRYGGGDGGPRSERLEMGLVFEDVLGTALASRAERFGASDALVRPGEVERDGIIGTPDMLDLEHEAVEEYKATWLSTKWLGDPPTLEHERFRYWVWQVKSYCAMVGYRTGRVRVLFVNGNYKFEGEGTGPQFHSFAETWTDRELDEHWRMIVGEARRIRARRCGRGGG